MSERKKERRERGRAGGRRVGGRAGGREGGRERECEWQASRLIIAAALMCVCKRETERESMREYVCVCV